MELVATTKLGFTKMDFRHAYFCEYVNKNRIFKKLFNFEKTSIYQLDYEPPKKIDSLADL